ncbi:16621_t:CDS:2 [Funneliformis mosseae]|uniref:16621_t:CDS:1 n=1 Tax=Funneliformis mosseae TaxID=27381 RepID=A0A9N9BDA1_FUNMO|nr:16621_t:CDS:2 [Funneliformis mosseae]
MNFLKNVEYGIQIQETSTYPLNNNILYWKHINQKTKRSFSYVIIKEETTWRQAASKQTICCKINYIDEIPQFHIRYSSNFQYIISSTKSSSNAALIYERTLKLRTKTTLLGSLVFGLQLESMQKACESKRRGNLIKLANNFKLKAIEFSVNKTDFQVNFGYKDQIKKNSQIQSIVKAVDQKQISRDFYQELAAVEHHLPCENSVSNEQIAITNYINNIIKISLVDIKEKNELEDIIKSEESDIMNFEIV